MFKKKQIEFSDMVSSISAIIGIVSIATLSLLLICIMKILRNVKMQPSLIKNESFQQKYGVLTEDLDLNSKGKVNNIAVYWNGLYLIRWMITVFILVYLKDHSSMQICLLFVISVVF